MRICILGAGALGSVIGGTLVEAGHEVTLVTRNQAHVEAVRSRGLVLRSYDVDRTIRLSAVINTDGMTSVDLVIVLVKSLDTETAMRAALRIVGAETLVISLQNGLGHEDVLGEIVGRSRVLAGKTYAGGVMLAPGHVIAGIAGKQTILGEIEGGVTARVAQLAEVLTAAGIETIATPDIRAAMWDKLLVNVATGALAAITGLTYGDLYAVTEIEETAISAVAEAMAVAQARGIALSTREPGEAWRKAASGLPPEFKTSMLQSLEKGARTEVDFINGAVVRAGKQTDVPTPVNATLVALVKGIEKRISQPPKAA